MTGSTGRLSSGRMAQGYTDQQRAIFAERLQKLAKLRGIQQADLIRRLRDLGLVVSDASLSQWFSGLHMPNPKRRKLLGEALGVTDDFLMGRTSASEFVINPAAMAAVQMGGDRNFPVYGSAEGGSGVMVLENEPIEYATRPSTLEGVRGAFAVYVVNDSMEPAYEQGDRIHVHPARPVSPGKDALFIREDADGTRYAMIKRLVRASETTWKVRQFNPAKTFDLPRSLWQKALRIVGSDRAD